MRARRLRAVAQVRPRDLVLEARRMADARQAEFGHRPLASYVGWTGFGNLGDELLFEAHRQLFPSLTFVPLASGPLRAVDRRLRRSARYRLAFLGGGTLINQSLRWKACVDHLLDDRITTVCLGTGVSPSQFRYGFESGEIHDWVPTLRRMDFVGVRGPLSQEMLRDHGLDVPVVGDTVFTLAPPERPKAGRKGVIGVNVGWSPTTIIDGDADRLAAETTDALRTLVRQGHRIKFLPVCGEDSVTCRSMQEALPEGRSDVVDAYDSVGRYLEEVGECQAFVGQKLHSVAVALLARVPSLMLAYQPKCEDLMLSMGLGDYTRSTASVEAAWIVAAAEGLLSDGAAVRAVIDRGVRSYRDLQFSLAEELTGKSASPKPDPVRP